MAKQEVTIITLNVQGLCNARNRKTLFSWLNCAKPDNVAMQETHCRSKEEFHSWLQTENREQNNLQRYLVESSPGTTCSAGVAILYKPCYKVESIASDTSGRVIVICFKHESVIHIVNIYGPNRKQQGEEFFGSLHQHIDPSFSTILCGDFNVVADSQVDRFGCNADSPWAYNWPSSLSSLTHS
jgi:exonuclease III